MHRYFQSIETLKSPEFDLENNENKKAVSVYLLINLINLRLLVVVAVFVGFRDVYSLHLSLCGIN